MATLRPPWQPKLRRVVEQAPVGSSLRLELCEPVDHHLDAVRCHRAATLCAHLRPDLELSLWLTSHLKDRAWTRRLPGRVEVAAPGERPAWTDGANTWRLHLTHKPRLGVSTGDSIGEYRGVAPRTDDEHRLSREFQRRVEAESPHWRTASSACWPAAPPAAGATWLVHQARFHLGDGLWLLPLLHAVRRRYRPGRVLVVGPARLDHFLASAGAEVLPLEEGATAADRARVLRRLDTLAIDSACGSADESAGESGSMSAALFAFARRPESLWLLEALAERGVPTRINLEYFDPDLDPSSCHAAATHEGWCFWNALSSPQMLTRALDPFEHALDAPADVSWNLEVDPGARSRARAALDARGIDREPYVILAPGGLSSHRWPVRKWTDLASRFAAAGLHVLVEGAPGELGLLRRVARGVSAGLGRVLAAADSLPEYLALLDGARLLVSGDNASIHLAHGVGTPTLYFAQLEKLVHSRPPAAGGVLCRPLWDEAGNDLRSISVGRAWGAVTSAVDGAVDRPAKIAVAS